ncbi:MAG: GH36-type glycosyl hydrolase domain-containing protein [Lachnospiraceae bacterium]
MSRIEFTDKNGSFRIKQPQNISYLYFPVAGEHADKTAGIKSSLTPLLGGDAKKNQNTFLLEPVSAENLHNNRSTRNFWCRMESEQGIRAWSATGVSAEQEAAIGSDAEEETELSAGFMWQTLKRSSRKYGLSSELTSFVPLSYPDTEMLLVTIKNTGKEACRFTPIAAVPMYARSADNIRDHRHVTSLLHRTITRECGVEITPTLTFDERGHKKNTVTYYVYGAFTGKSGECADSTGCADALDTVVRLPVGTIPATEDFIGEGGSFTHPEAVYRSMQEKVVPAGTALNGYETVGALVFEECFLKPGEGANFVLCMGIDEENERESLIKSIQKKSFIDWQETLAEAKEYWRRQVNVRFHTGDERFDSYLCWIAFQPVLRRIYGCSFLPHHDYGKGGRGWRDLWQDCLALLLMNPGGVRTMLLSNFGGVRMDGSNATIIGAKQGEFLADRNNITRVWMDHGFWPLHTTNFYIRQTGDIGLLLEEANYFKDKQVARGEKKDELWNEAYGTKQKDKDGRVVSGTVLEHILVQNLTAFYDVGEHNRIRLRGADWNDALDMAAERGESVAFTYAYAGNLGTLSELLTEVKRRGTKRVLLAKELEVLLSGNETLFTDVTAKQKLLSDYCDSVSHHCSGEKKEYEVSKLIAALCGMENWLKETLRQEEWLGGEPGFFNGYYDNSGRRVEKNEPGNIRMMLTGQVFAVMSGTASEEQIAELVKAADRYLYREDLGGYRLNTDFGEVKDDLGRMFGFAYGHKENGAVFSHMAVMFGAALYQRGFAKEGYQALHTLYRQAEKISVSRITPGIPEYFNDRGRGMYHYLTGAASWYLMTVLTEMFGVQGRFGDLYFVPKLLAEQFDKNGQASAEFMFAGRSLKVVYTFDKRDQEEKIPEKKGAQNMPVVKGVTAHRKQFTDCIPRAELETWDVAIQHEIRVLLA